MKNHAGSDDEDGEKSDSDSTDGSGDESEDEDNKSLVVEDNRRISAWSTLDDRDTADAGDRMDIDENSPASDKSSSDPAPALILGTMNPGRFVRANDGKPARFNPLNRPRMPSALAPPQPRQRRDDHTVHSNDPAQDCPTFNFGSLPSHFKRRDG